MDVNVIFQLAGIGILVAVIHSVLKQAGKEDFAWLVTLGGITVVLYMVIQMINQLFRTVRTMFQL